MYKTVIGGEEMIEYAVRLIKEDEIVAFPTETVYGLGGNAFSERAAERIFLAKNRPSDNPFIVHTTSIEGADEVAYVSDDAVKVLKRFSPGPITVVLPKRDRVPHKITAGLDTVGIRIPSHRMAREFLSACGVPIAAPSANRSKKVSPTEAMHVLEDLNGYIPLILEGGRCDVGIESTVLSLVGETPVILRPGAVTLEMLREILPSVTVHSGQVGTPSSPGMKYKHYAPIVPCVLFTVTERAREEYARLISEGKRTVIFAKAESLGDFEGLNAVSMGSSGEEIAHEIFAMLRKYEKCVDFILIQALNDDGINMAVMNRLIKSADNRVI